MVLAQHLLHSLASIFTVSGFCACSSLLRRDFVTKDFDLAADLDDGKPGGGVTDPALAALAGGAFGAGSKNTAAEDATATGFGSLVKAAFFLAGCSQALVVSELRPLGAVTTFDCLRIQATSSKLVAEV